LELLNKTNKQTELLVKPTELMSKKTAEDHNRISPSIFGLHYKSVIFIFQGWSEVPNSLYWFYLYI